MTLLYGSMTPTQLEDLDYISAAEIKSLAGDEAAIQRAVGAREEILQELHGADKSQIPVLAIHEFASRFLPKNPGDGSYESKIAEAFVRAHTAFTEQSQGSHGAKSPTYLETFEQAIAIYDKGLVDERITDLEAARGKRPSRVTALLSLLSDSEIHVIESAPIGASTTVTNTATVEAPSVPSMNEASFTQNDSIADALPASKAVEPSTSKQSTSNRQLARLEDIEPELLAKTRLKGHQLINWINEFQLTKTDIIEIAHVANLGVAPAGILIALKSGHEVDQIVSTLVSVLEVSEGDDRFSSVEAKLPKARTLTIEEKDRLEQDGTAISFELVNRFQEYFGIHEADLVTSLQDVVAAYKDAVELNANSRNKKSQEYAQGARAILEQVLEDAQRIERQEGHRPDIDILIERLTDSDAMPSTTWGDGEEFEDGEIDS